MLKHFVVDGLGIVPKMSHHWGDPDLSAELEDDPFCCGVQVLGRFRLGDESSGLIKKLREDRADIVVAIKKHLDEASAGYISTTLVDTEECRLWRPILRAVGFRAVDSFINDNTKNKVTVYGYKS